MGKAKIEYPKKSWKVEKAQHRLRLGDNDPKNALEKPKDWSFIRPIDGRKGKPKRVKEVAIKKIMWSAHGLQMTLMDIGAGTPECKWDVSALSPFRKLTSRDVCYILQALQKKSNDDYVEIRYSEIKRILTIVDCSEWIKNGGDVLAQETNNA